MVNRNTIKMWFVTMPHSMEYTPDTLVDKIWGPRERLLEAFSGCKETHADGVTPHIHLNVRLKVKVSGTTLLNRLRVIFPGDYKRIDFRPTREHYDKADYLFKEDVAPVIWENPEFVARKPIGKRRKAILGILRSAMETYRGIGSLWLPDIEATMKVWDDNDDPRPFGPDNWTWYNHLGERKLGVDCL